MAGRRHSANYSRGKAAQRCGLLLAFVMITLVARAANQSREQIIKIVTEIQRADYVGNREALKRLHDELGPEVENKKVGARVQYWRGFALWRRAINGFNDNVGPQDLQADLKQALDEFDDSARKDPQFGDAKIAALSCVSLIGASVRMSTPDRARIQDLLAEWKKRREDAESAGPENPRLFWVLGPDMMFVPPERGGGQAKAIEMYKRGLTLIRQHTASASDALDPTWGEPELLMNLAYTNLHGNPRNVAAAERYAQDALALVPYWHYVRDILLPQIRTAKPKQ